MKWLKNRELTKSGIYILTRTDDMNSYSVTEVWEHRGDFCVHEAGELNVAEPISNWDDECRWLLLEPPTE